MDYYGSLNAANIDPDYPTIFELLSARELKQLVNPSIRYIVAHYAERHPQYLLRVFKRLSEILLIVSTGVEYYHLKIWNASFTERFYGLKRTNLLALPAKRTRALTSPLLEPQRRLKKQQLWLSLASIVLLPYIQDKLEARYEILKGRYAFESIRSKRPPISAPLRVKLCHWVDELVLDWYPFWRFFDSVSTILFCAGYMFHHTYASNWTDLILRTKYARLTKWDYQMNEPDESSRKWYQKFSLSQLPSTCFRLFNYALPTALFVLKFLEWLNTSDLAKQFNQKGPLLPPPHSEEIKSQGCPLCGRADIENPTALESGAIFCYKCIYNKIQATDKKSVPQCPVKKVKLLLTTWNDATEAWDIGSLRRLML